MPKSKQGKKILLTAAIEDSEGFKKYLSRCEVSMLHLPLERYVAIKDDRAAKQLAEKVESTENIVYGHKRNARFFLRMAREHDFGESVKNCVNLAADNQTHEFLENQGVPAIFPGSEEPIKMLEFMLRLRRTGPTLYPCGGHKTEEIPALLQELDIPVTEEVLYHLEGPTEEELDTFKEQVTENNLDLIIYHSRRSVNRINTAFPDLDPGSAIVVAGDQAVSDKLKELEIKVDSVAEGTWNSILDRVKAAI